MVSSSAQPASRYRRRILGLGALATGALYVIGAPFFNARIESDLERRVPSELAAAGFDGLAVTFSGQDGTVTCRSPLDDPEGARAAAYDVHGVRSIELDRSCRVNAASATTPPADDDVSDSGDASDESSDDVAPSPTVTTATTTTEPSDTTEDTERVTVRDIVAADPDLAFLAVLLADTEIGRSDEPITLFAPNNAAFDAVPSDVLVRLQDDPDLLAQVLNHHIVEGEFTSDRLVTGELMALDGLPLEVALGEVVTVGGATVIGTDVVAANGVVHVIDQVLLSPDVESPPGEQLAPAAVTYDGTSLMLTGVVASEVERQVVVEAAVGAVGPSLVTDAMTVDPETGLSGERVASLAVLVNVLPTNLSTGEVGFNGTTLYASGVVRSVTAREAFTASATSVGVEPSLTRPPAATDEDAADLETELNAFVAQNPILFQPTSAVLAPTASTVIDRVAADFQRFGDITITVEGHTDSDGLPGENLQLSQNRADAVRAALIERGVAAESIEAIGFGSERPVVVDGVEDKAASRRVEFRVVATS